MTNIALYEPYRFVATDNYSDESDRQWFPLEENASACFDRKVDTKLLDFFDMAKENFEKVRGKVDRNGEPLPQYITEK